CAGARAVVFQEKSIVVQLVEYFFGNRIVAPLAMPHAALIPAAEMNTESDAIEQAEDLVMRVDGTREIFHRILTAIAHLLQGRPVHISRVARRIDLNVAATGIPQTANHCSYN